MNNINIQYLTERPEYLCSCGKKHSAHLKAACIQSGAIKKLPEFINRSNGHNAYVVADATTYSVAGEKVKGILENNNICFSEYVYSSARIEPDDEAVGSAFLNFNYTCDVIIGIGSGVINDICKIVSAMTGLPYIIVATAASMDGYASSTSSVIRGGLKVSVDSRCPDYIIGDLDILCTAPTHMTASGLGDMLAKYISICEWRIGNIVTGEYYCEDVAQLIRDALKKCVESVDGVVTSDPESIKNIMEGLVISGIAADYAGISRPVSGTEHYFSHIWDMRAVEFSTPMDLHGIQCGIGTLLTAKIYNKIKTAVPDYNKSVAYFNDFNKKYWDSAVLEYLGRAGEKMVINSRKCDLYNREKHISRVNNIINNFGEIVQVIEEEIPDFNTIYDILVKSGAPTECEQIGIDSSLNSLTFRMTKDIRDKYISSSLAFDLGILDEIAEEIFNR